MITDDVPPGWAQYVALQQQVAKSNRLTRRVRGADATLSRLLDAMPDAPEKLRCEALTPLQIHRMAENQGTTERLRDLATPRQPHADPSAPVDEVVAAREMLTRLERAAGPVAWRYLFAIGEGASYGEIALRYGVTVAAAKSAVCRARASLLAANDDVELFLAG
jgi:DNA-directed RNA polymerase specialized sigma24 family protein